MSTNDKQPHVAHYTRRRETPPRTQAEQVGEIIRAHKDAAPRERFLHDMLNATAEDSPPAPEGQAAEIRQKSTLAPHRAKLARALENELARHEAEKARARLADAGAYEREGGNVPNLVEVIYEAYLVGAVPASEIARELHVTEEYVREVVRTHAPFSWFVEVRTDAGKWEEQDGSEDLWPAVDVEEIARGLLADSVSAGTRARVRVWKGHGPAPDAEPVYVAYTHDQDAN
ncbi:glycosyltransferase GlgA [Streptomyces sp. NBRC 110611]|uniref:hypothetical protein n=1 Tax=Streptomyces sp. NBRC 110611 TaxID=1621259 RepID=UPI00082E0D26|nr:hypothetical protein [Streptomyces sp. NBRC 110611]GAU67670.1 glycosyltransferase GlgA [Streptomyces sp. NBRC 110611]